MNARWSGSGAAGSSRCRKPRCGWPRLRWPTATPPCLHSALNSGSNPRRSTGTSGPKASCASRAKRSSAPEPECSPRKSSTLPPPANNPNWAKVYDYYDASGIIDKIDDYLFDRPLLLIGEDGANLINRSTPIAFMAQGKY